MEKFIQSLKNLFKPKSNNVLGVDISSSSVKVVELTRKNGRPSLVTYGELSLGPYAGVEVGRATNLHVDRIVEALGDITREAKVSTNNSGVAIPMSSSLIRLIEMPDVGEEKLKGMIPLEIRKYIPVPISEVMIDWWIIPRADSEESSQDFDLGEEELSERGTVDVLVVAIHNEIISRYQEIVKKAGLQSSFFEIEIFSTLRSVLDRSSKPIMIVDMGAATTKVYVVERGIIRSSHIVSTGSQDLTLSLSSTKGISVSEAEEEKREVGVSRSSPEIASQGSSPAVVLENILSEAKRVKLNFEHKEKKRVSAAIFTGGGALVRGLEEPASRLLEVPIQLADPFAKVEAPDFLNNLLKQIGPEFSVAIGVALRKLDE